MREHLADKIATQVLELTNKLDILISIHRDHETLRFCLLAAPQCEWLISRCLPGPWSDMLDGYHIAASGAFSDGPQLWLQYLVGFNVLVCRMTMEQLL